MHFSSSKKFHIENFYKVRDIFLRISSSVKNANVDTGNSLFNFLRHDFFFQNNIRISFSFVSLEKPNLNRLAIGKTTFFLPIYYLGKISKKLSMAKLENHFIFYLPSIFGLWHRIQVPWLAWCWLNWFINKSAIFGTVRSFLMVMVDGLTS